MKSLAVERRTITDTGPDYGPTDRKGRTFRPIAVEEVAETTTKTIKRARRAYRLESLDLPNGHLRAAWIFRQAVEHIEAGMGMGPIPGSRDVSGGSHSGSVWLAPQERALSAADWHRRGVQAMGLAASEGVVNWVVIRDYAVTEYDVIRRWRRHTSIKQLRAALERLAVEYGTA